MRELCVTFSDTCRSFDALISDCLLTAIPAIGLNKMRNRLARSSNACRYELFSLPENSSSFFVTKNVHICYKELNAVLC